MFNDYDDLNIYSNYISKPNRLMQQYRAAYTGKDKVRALAKKNENLQKYEGGMYSGRTCYAG